MKKLAVLLLVLILASCAAPAAPPATATPIPPSETPLPPTDTPAPTNTPRPTSTRKPTSTHVPPPKPSKTPDAATIRAEFLDLMRQILEEDQTIKTVNMVRATDGMLEIEVRSIFASDDVLKTSNYDIAQTLSRVFKGLEEPKLADLVDGEKFTLSIAVVGAIGSRKAVSLTDFATVKKLQDLKITQSEWETAAGLKFVE